MDVISRNILKEKCPKCDSNLEAVVEQWEPFPGEGTFNGEVVYCKGCDFELVTYDPWKNPLNPSGGPYLGKKHGDLTEIKSMG